MDQPTTDLSAVRRPINQARGLPNAHYIDDAIIAEESQAVLAGQWAGLAVASDVPEIGDALPIDFLSMPLLLVRSRSGTVRVFQNICRHRGMILVAEPRKIEGAIRCPYHSWCYSTDGKLVSTPHVGGPGQNTHADIDRSLLGLIEVRSHVWRDVIWINISGDAPAFEDAFADLIERWADFDKPLYHGGSESHFTTSRRRAVSQVRALWSIVSSNPCPAKFFPISPTSGENGMTLPNISRPILMCFWVRSAIMPLQSFWSPQAKTAQLNMFTSTMQSPSLTRPCASTMLTSGKASFPKTCLWSKACSAGGLVLALMAESSHLRWTVRPIISTIGWPKLSKPIAPRPIQQRTP